jgi:hypothetical protein
MHVCTCTCTKEFGKAEFEDEDTSEYTKHTSENKAAALERLFFARALYKPIFSSGFSHFAWLLGLGAG